MKAQRGSSGTAVLFMKLGARWGWVVNAMPRSFYPQERPDTHRIGGWVGTRAGLDGCGKTCPHWFSIPGPPIILAASKFRFSRDIDASKLRFPLVSVPSDKHQYTTLRWRTNACFFPDFFFHVNWTPHSVSFPRHLSRDRFSHLIFALNSGYSSLQHSPIGPLVE
jgi:hypothetical protein